MSRMRVRSSTSLVNTRSPRRAADATTTASTNVAPRTRPNVSPTNFASEGDRGSTSTASRMRAAGPRCPRHHSETTGAGTVMRAPAPNADVMKARMTRSRRSIATRAPVSNVIIVVGRPRLSCVAAVGRPHLRRVHGSPRRAPASREALHLSPSTTPPREEQPVVFVRRGIPSGPPRGSYPRGAPRSAPIRAPLRRSRQTPWQSTCPYPTSGRNRCG